MLPTAAERRPVYRLQAFVRISQVNAGWWWSYFYIRRRIFWLTFLFIIAVQHFRRLSMVHLRFVSSAEYRTVRLGRNNLR